MNVQRVERIADFVRDTGGKQRERLHPLAFNGFKGLLPRLGGVVQNERHPGTAGGFAVQRRGIEPQKTRTRIMHLKFMAGDALAPRDVGLGNFFPIHFGQPGGDVLSFHTGLQTNQARYGLVEINDAALLIHHQHAVFNRVEQCFEEAALASKPLDDRLQTFRVQPPDTAKHFVEKTGFRRWH